MKKLSLALAASIVLLFASSASAAPAKGNLATARAMSGMTSKLAAATPTPPPAVKKTHRALPRATQGRILPRFRMRPLAR